MNTMRSCTLLIAVALAVLGCDPETTPPPVDGHGPIAPNISARLGEPIPTATEAQLETFDRGRKVALRRFDRRDGLGPAFNVTFCASCHEKPVFGGSAGLYRNFFLSGVRNEQGAFFPGESAGEAGGVIRLYGVGEGVSARIPIPEETNIFAQRNPIPFFGVGLLAEIDGREILRRADPDDLDGDGISGRPNFDRGFVGRFGRKSQTVSIEGFIRGPLFNHLGITTVPLGEGQRASLPVDSSIRARVQGLRIKENPQAAAQDGPLFDEDEADDPELSGDDLFDLVSFAMLLAAPRIEPLNEVTRRGLEVFDAIKCGDCHTPRLQSPRGPLPVYSDLLLHDMGEGLADGLEQGEARGNEFRTQPLWGLAATGPYLHDGRATTIEEAIAWHDGEGRQSRRRFEALDGAQRDDLIAFLLSLGGRDQLSPGLLPEGEPVPDVGDYGGPFKTLDGDEARDFLAGRAVFDRDFGLSEGVGGPRFNGDSCRACHFEPIIGGAGPRGVNVTRHGIKGASGGFVPPAVGSILHRLTALEDIGNRPQAEASIFEHRQTPHLFGLGLIEAIPEALILAQADPHDEDGDGISGRASLTDGDRLGRFGWKAQVPSIDEFVRDAVTAELGMTIAPQEGLTFGKIHDNDDVPDPEFSLSDAELLARYLSLLGPPPRGPLEGAQVDRGQALFEEVGCASCHTPTLESDEGPVHLYSDLLLHEIMPPDAVGIEDASANIREFRTAPLWGVRDTAPYMHDGAADTLAEAIDLHEGEGAESRDAFLDLDESGRSALLEFLGTL